MKIMKNGWHKYAKGQVFWLNGVIEAYVHYSPHSQMWEIMGLSEVEPADMLFFKMKDAKAEVMAVLRRVKRV